MIKEMTSLLKYKTLYPISMDFASRRDMHLVLALNTSTDSRPQTKNRVKNPTVER